MSASPALISPEESRELIELPYMEVEELILVLHPQNYLCQRFRLEGEGAKRLGRSYVFVPSEEIKTGPIYQYIENMINPGLYEEGYNFIYFSREEGKFNPPVISQGENNSQSTIKYCSAYEQLPIEILPAPRELQAQRGRKDLRFLEQRKAKRLLKCLGYSIFLRNDSSRISHEEVAKRWVRIQSAAIYFVYQYPELRENQTELMEYILNYGVQGGNFSAEKTKRRLREKLREVIPKDPLRPILAPPKIFPDDSTEPNYEFLNVYANAFGQVYAMDFNNKGDHRDLLRNPGACLVMNELQKEARLAVEDELIFAWSSARANLL